MFTERIFKLLKKIPAGKVTTYKALAVACGNPNAARAVGKILNSNKNLIVVPCHRVICSDGSVSGYATGIEKKIELLRKEGIDIYAGKVRKQYILPKL